MRKRRWFGKEFWVIRLEMAHRMCWRLAGSPLSSRALMMTTKGPTRVEVLARFDDERLNQLQWQLRCAERPVVLDDLPEGSLVLHVMVTEIACNSGEKVFRVAVRHICAGEVIGGAQLLEP